MPAESPIVKGNIYNLPENVGTGSRRGRAAGKMCKRGRTSTPARWSLTMSQTLGWVLAAALVGGGVAVVSLWPSPSRPEPTGKEEPRLPIFHDETQGKDPPKKTDFATGGNAKDDAKPVKFDSERALKYLKQLCDIGPRISATDAMKKQQEIIEKHFKDLGATITRQEFKAKQLSRKAETPMVNFIFSWNPDKERRILISTHYDTRPIADQEANRGNWNKPFVSANDGTSGVAFLMELGNHMKDLKCEFGVDFVLFDGEEYVFETSAVGGGDKYFFGSEHFAELYAKSKGKRKYRYDSGILLDLFAGKKAQLKVEINSLEAAPKLVEQVWGVAKALGAKSFKYERGYEVQDDHLALNRVGIPTIDIIDFDYPHWHRLSDTFDKVSGDQMAEVSNVLSVWLQKIK